MTSSNAHDPLRLNLALQGGGAHGAFTWGVLDRLLDEPGFAPDRISGSSAGALNGAALATGYAKGGPKGAKENLALLWQRVAESGAMMSMLHVPLRKPSLGVWDDAMPLLSPYQTNIFALEPLRYIVDSVADARALNADGAPALFVNAVSINTGASRTFGPGDLCLDAIIASACAPFMFQAVQIGEECYWDGSYGGNPILRPLYEGRAGADILLVELTPLGRAETPTTAKNILNRINEIASINALSWELQQLEALNRSRPGATARMHVISLPETESFSSFEPSTKRTIGCALFQALRRRGIEACDEWLAENRHAVGRRSTVDVEKRYLQPQGRRAA
jgi:NTE family protein